MANEPDVLPGDDGCECVSPSWGPSWDGRINLTNRVHASMHVCWMSNGALGVNGGTWIYRIWPRFEGYWFNLSVDLWRLNLSIYIGE